MKMQVGSSFIISRKHESQHVRLREKKELMTSRVPFSSAARTLMAVLAAVAFACDKGTDPTPPSITGSPSPSSQTELFNIQKWLLPFPTLAGETGYGAVFTVEGPGTLELTATYRADPPGPNPNVLLILHELPQKPGNTITPTCSGWTPEGICLGNENRLDPNENPKSILYSVETSGQHYYTAGVKNLGPGPASVTFTGWYTQK